MFKRINLVGQHPADIMREMVNLGFHLLNLGTDGRAEEVMPLCTLYLMPTNEGLQVGLHLDADLDREFVMGFLHGLDGELTFLGQVPTQEFEEEFAKNTQPDAFLNLSPDNVITKNTLQ